MVLSHFEHQLLEYAIPAHTYTPLRHKKHYHRLMHRQAEQHWVNSQQLRPKRPPRLLVFSSSIFPTQQCNFVVLIAMLCISGELELWWSPTEPSLMSVKDDTSNPAPLHTALSTLHTGHL